MKSGWRLPGPSKNALSEICGLTFDKTFLGNLQSKDSPTDTQHVILRHLKFEGAIQLQWDRHLARNSKKLILITHVDPYALQLCKDDLQIDLPKNLKAVKPYIEKLTGCEWTLKGASLTAILPPATDKEAQINFYAPLIKLQNRNLIKIFRHQEEGVCIIVDCVPNLGANLVSTSAPKYFKPSGPHRLYDLGDISPLKIFKDGRLVLNEISAHKSSGLKGKKHMQSTCYWVSPVGEQDALTQITGIPFKVLPKTEVLECVEKPTPQQFDVLHYLSLTKAIDMRVQKPAFGHNPHRGGLVWVDAVDPLKLSECREMLAVDVPTGLAAAKPRIERLTGQSWTLNRASLTTALNDRVINTLGELEHKRLIKMDYREDKEGNPIVAIYDVSSRLADPKLAKPPKAFRGPSLSETTVYNVNDIGRLGIFPGGQMTPAWRNWGPLP